MNIRIGTEEDKRDIIGKYPHTKQVLGEEDIWSLQKKMRI